MKKKFKNRSSIHRALCYLKKPNKYIYILWTYASRGTARRIDKPFLRFIGTLAYSYIIIHLSPPHLIPHPSSIPTPPIDPPPPPQKKIRDRKRKLFTKDTTLSEFLSLILLLLHLYCACSLN